MVRHESEVPALPVYGEGVNRVAKQILVGPREGFTGFLREFSLEPGGHTPYHRHDWYHVVYVLGGSGSVRIEGRETPLRSGSVVHAPAGTEHGFRAAADVELRFLCLVPERGDRYAEGE